MVAIRRIHWPHLGQARTSSERNAADRLRLVPSAPTPYRRPALPLRDRSRCVATPAKPTPLVDNDSTLSCMRDALDTWRPITADDDFRRDEFLLSRTRVSESVVLDELQS